MPHVPSNTHLCPHAQLFTHIQLLKSRVTLAFQSARASSSPREERLAFSGQSSCSLDLSAAAKRRNYFPMWMSQSLAPLLRAPSFVSNHFQPLCPKMGGGVGGNFVFLHLTVRRQRAWSGLGACSGIAGKRAGVSRSWRRCPLPVWLR